MVFVPWFTDTGDGDLFALEIRPSLRLQQHTFQCRFGISGDNLASTYCVARSSTPLQIFEIYFLWGLLKLASICDDESVLSIKTRSLLLCSLLL